MADEVILIKEMVPSSHRNQGKAVIQGMRKPVLYNHDHPLADREVMGKHSPIRGDRKGLRNIHRERKETDELAISRQVKEGGTGR